MANLSLSQLQALFRAAGWPESQIAKGAAIAMYESNGNPKALNDGSSTNTNEYSVGLMQINTLAHRGYSIAQLQDPLTNLRIALGIWQGRPSWADWYNSNRKFNSNYLGIAAKSLALYSQGGGVVSTVSVTPVSNAIDAGTHDILTDTGSNDKTIFIIAAVGLLALALIGSRQYY